MALTNTTTKQNLKASLFDTIIKQDATIFNQSPEEFKQVLTNIETYIEWLKDDINKN